MMDLDALLVAGGALITAIGGLILSYAQGAKALAEARATRGAAEHTARQVSPNHGSSLADGVKRIEGRQVDQGRELGGLRRDLRQLRDEKVDEHDDLRRRLRHLEMKAPKHE